MALRIFLLACAGCLATVAAHAETATGRVFHDANGNGTLDAGETGVPDALVSNGAEIVETDGSGHYTIDMTPPGQLFVIKPRGWKLPVNAHNLPRYYYLHRPEGSPEMRFPGVEPTGPLPEAVNFPLTPHREPDRFRALIFGDPQPYSPEEVDYFLRDIVDELIGVEDVAFGLTLGDIVGDDLSLFEPVNGGIGKIGVPWWNVYGNHDMNFDAESDERADDTFERVYGPSTYAFQYGPVWFLVLDNVIYPTPEDDDRFYVAGYREDQIAFVRNLLAHVPREQLVVFAQHIPLFSEDYHPKGTINREQRARLFDCFKNHPHTLSLSAHTHTMRHDFFGPDRGWHGERHHHFNVGTTSGSWWRGPPDERGIPQTAMRDGSPNGYCFITFDGNDYQIRWKSANRPADDQIGLFASRTVARGDSWAGFITANFYAGSPDAKLEMRVDGGKWKPLKRKLRPDPAYARMRYNRAVSPTPREGRALPAPDTCRHLWVGRLPAKRSVGTHRIEVRATDRTGREFKAHTTYRIVK